MNLSSKEVVHSFKVGDLVTTELYIQDKDVIRTITKIEYNSNTGSGITIWADNGGICPCCNRAPSIDTGGVDGAWFLPANRKVDVN